jgi:WD40 repeat protein
MRTLPLLLLLGCPPSDPLDPTLRDVIVLAGPDVVTPVGVEVVFDGRESTQGDAIWDLGDGTRIEGQLVRHTYATPGNYLAVLQVTGPGGLTRSDGVQVTAHLPAADPLPVASSAITFDAARQRVFVVEPDADQLTAFDATLGTPTRVTTCDHPRTLALSGDELGVACERGDAMWTYDATTLGEVRRWPLTAGTRPYGVAGRGDDWWIAGQGRGEIIAIDGLSFDRRVVGVDTRAIAVDQDGDVVATRFRSGSFEGEVYPFEGGIWSLARDPGPDSAARHRGVPNLLGTAVFSPDGGTLYVGGLTANIQRGDYRDGEAISPRMLAHATVFAIDAATGQERAEGRRVVHDQGQVSALALSPLGNWLWVAYAGSGTVHRLDAYTLDRSAVLTGVGAGLDGLVLSDDGSTLFAHASLDRTVTAWDVADPAAPPTLLWTASTVDGEPLDALVLRGKRLFNDATDPRLSEGGLIACATCHPHGRHDGMTWDLTDRGEGLRNTITLEGRGGTDMGRLNWTATWDEAQDVEAFIRNVMGGHGLLDEASWENPAIQASLGQAKSGLSDDLDALAAYLHSLTETPISPYATTGDGAVLFVRRDCSRCHIPDQLYTDSASPTAPTYDIGTYTPASGKSEGRAFDEFDTPTLLGVWSTAPYLHDGSAINLEAAIGAHEYGETLTPQEIITLAAYVRTL